MGTDIWIYVERRYHRNGEAEKPWRHQMKHHQRRNYELFSRLAGVRQSANVEIEPIDAPRGLPEDTSPEVRAQQEGIRGHHTSWLRLEEAVHARGIDRSFDLLLDYLVEVNHTTGGLDRYDTRLIFFFDS